MSMINMCISFEIEMFSRDFKNKTLWMRCRQVHSGQRRAGLLMSIACLIPTRCAVIMRSCLLFLAESHGNLHMLVRSSVVTISISPDEKSKRLCVNQHRLMSVFLFGRSLPNLAPHNAELQILLRQKCRTFVVLELFYLCCFNMLWEYLKRV